MFSRGIVVVLKYRVVPVITNDSLSKRTMSVVKAKFPVIFGSAKGDSMEKILTSRDQR